jgi:pectinesterase
LLSGGIDLRNCGWGREKVHVPARKPFITIRGSGSDSTVVTWNARASDRGQSGGILGTYDSASVAIDSDYFVAKAITFQVLSFLLPPHHHHHHHHHHPLRSFSPEAAMDGE